MPGGAIGRAVAGSPVPLFVFASPDALWTLRGPPCLGVVSDAGA